MFNTIDISIEHSTFLTENGIEVYIGEVSNPVTIIDLEEETNEFLNDTCDGDGKIYREMSEELELIIKKFKTCLKLLEDAKR